MTELGFWPTIVTADMTANRGLASCCSDLAALFSVMKHGEETHDSLSSREKVLVNTD